MISAADRARHAQAVAEIFTFMRKRRLALEDLIEYGGAELKSSNPKTRETARHVEKCWALMARLSVNYAHLEQAPAADTAKPARARRGEGHFSEVIENKEVSTPNPGDVKSLKNNNKTDNHSVGVSEKSSGKGRWRHKRRLAAA